MKRLAPFAILFVLSACTAGTQAVIDEALARSETGIKAAKDREAIALKQAPCLIGIGAKNRVLTKDEQNAVESLCGGSPGLTLQDLTDLSRAMQAVRDAPGAGFLADGLPAQ